MGSHSPPPAARRLLPQPVETSYRSSRPVAAELHDTCTPISTDRTAPPDGFRSETSSQLPDRETLSRGPTSSASPPILPRPTENTSRNIRRFLPQPAETTTRSSKERPAGFGTADANCTSNRRHLPEPIETASTSSVHLGSSSGRQVLPQPTETISRSSKRAANWPPKGLDEGHHQEPPEGPFNESNSPKPTRRFAPEPIEVVRLSNRKLASDPNDARKAESGKTGSSLPSSFSQNSPRKFTPQLIETGKRSFRRGDITAAVSVNGDVERSSARRTLVSSLLNGTNAISLPPESRFSYASLVRRQESRRHSFRVPDLPAIPSNSSEGSDGSDVPSLSTSPSTSDESAKRSKIADERRESCDERFSGYLLSLAALSAEKQLRDQALAAFPNEQVYQPVSHFAIDREEEDSEIEEEAVDVMLRDIKGELAAFRRESAADLPWELEQMRRYKEEAEMRDRAKEINGSESRFPAAAIAARRALNSGQPATSPNIIGGWQKEVGSAQMSHAASPPLLGSDLVFPQSLSPQSTWCETDQAPVSHHEDIGKGCENCGGLWCANSHMDDNCQGGLWMGMCKKRNEPNELPSQISRPGIMTPATDIESQTHLTLNIVAVASQVSQLPTTPPEADSRLADVDRRLSVEKEIEGEFHDGFVTQVYNYLSLGYPSLARYYDYELSKISGIPVEELRRDDLHTDAKGYVGAPEGVGVEAEGVTGSKCMRWTALRLYIREWARQQPRMAGDDGLEAWGVRERRGSWAV